MWQSTYFTRFGYVLLLGYFLLTNHAIAGFSLETILQRSVQKYGTKAEAVVRNWQNMLSQAEKLSELKKISLVNDYFNQKLAYISDHDIWQQEDYWATPIEALLKGKADCEDYAIAKYFSLLFAGIPANKMRITYVNAEMDDDARRPYSQAHMVLSYYPTPNAEPLILDNLEDEIELASKREDLTPVYGFNTEIVWLASTGATDSRVSRLSKWRTVLEKMQSEGFVF